MVFLRGAARGALQLMAQAHDDFYTAEDIVAQEAFIFANAMCTTVIGEIIPIVKVMLPNEASVAIPDPGGEAGS